MDLVKMTRGCATLCLHVRSAIYFSCYHYLYHSKKNSGKEEKQKTNNGHANTNITVQKKITIHICTANMHANKIVTFILLVVFLVGLVKPNYII